MHFEFLYAFSKKYQGILLMHFPKTLKKTLVKPSESSEHDEKHTKTDS